MRIHARLLAIGVGLAAVLTGAPQSGSASDAEPPADGAMTPAPVCEVDRPVVFADLDWDSSSVHNAIARFVLAHGFGCQVELLAGSTIPLLTAMAQGKVDITMEMWADNVGAAWQTAVERGQAMAVGTSMRDGRQAWFVPRYLVEGEDAPAADLVTARDLAKHWELFATPEEPTKGRFLNCIVGWGCELVNTKKLYAYGLAAHFENVRPETGAAMAAEIEAALAEKKPIVFYHWEPTWLLGRYTDELVELVEPAYDPIVWEELTETRNPGDVERATAYPPLEVLIAANASFVPMAPRIVDFLGRYRIPGPIVSEALAFMEDTAGSADEAAIWFLRRYPEIWRDWLPQDVADRVAAALPET